MEQIQHIMAYLHSLIYIEILLVLSSECVLKRVLHLMPAYVKSYPNRRGHYNICKNILFLHQSPALFSWKILAYRKNPILQQLNILHARLALCIDKNLVVE